MAVDKVQASASIGGVKVNDLKVVGEQEAAIASLTHAVGTADGTVDDVGGSFNQTTLNNNFKEVTAKIAAILTALRNHGIIAT